MDARMLSPTVFNLMERAELMQSFNKLVSTRALLVMASLQIHISNFIKYKYNALAVTVNTIFILSNESANLT